MRDDTEESPETADAPVPAGRGAAHASTSSPPSPVAISRDGRHARERGDPRSANPHPEGSQERAVWERGYAMPDDEASAG